MIKQKPADKHGLTNSNCGQLPLKPETMVFGAVDRRRQQYMDWTILSAPIGCFILVSCDFSVACK